MNFQHFLDERLNFAIYLYDSAVPPFEEIKRKINENEPPYEECRHPEDDGSEPMFLEQWEQADLAVDVLGMTCLGQVQIALNTFLREFTLRSFGQEALDSVGQMKQKSWLGNYRAAYETNPDLDWKNSGANLELLEEVVLTRNDFQHNAELLTQYTFQDKKHQEKYPDSSFLHPTWRTILRDRRLYVTREKLVDATDAVRTLAEYLDEALLNAQCKARVKARSEAKATIPAVSA